MKYIGLSGLFVLFFLLAACNAPAPTAAGTLEAEANYWQLLGNNAGTGSNASLVSDGSSNTIMASVAFDGTANSVYVRRWDGSTWTQLGPALSAVGGFTNAASPSLALDSSGNPVLAVSEDTAGIFTIYVRRWQNGSWVSVGSALNAETNDNNFDTDAIEPSLALDSLGNPVVSWSEISGSDGVRRIYVWRWTGVVWQSLGSLIVAGDTRNPSLAIDSSDNPVVAWQDYSGGVNYDLYVRRFNGSSWVQYAPGSLDINAGFPAYDPSLALDSTNNPIVAWYEELGGNSLNVYVKRWNGTAWVQYGAGGPLDITPFNTAYAPSVALDNGGNPTVAWSEFGASTYTLYMKQWTGSAWTFVGTNPLSNTANHAHYPSLSLINGTLVVGWQEGASTTPGTSDSLYVKRYVTNAWQDLGGLLDVAGGQSALNSSIARKSNNYPTVAWDEADSGNGSRNVYVKDWTGSAWKVLGAALDTALGNDAENPSLAMRTDNVPTLAWQESNNIYVKKWSGSSWGSIGAALDTVLANDALTPSLTLDTTNLPVVAYAENGNILVKKANGVLTTSLWTSPFGTTPLDTSVANEAYRPSLALRSDGRPIVAWYEDAGTSFNIYAKEWNGTAWVALGTTIDRTATQDAKDIVLAIRTDNRPVVAWEEAGNIYAKRWTGTSWVSLGATLDKTTGNEALRPAIDLRSDNNPVVTWQEWNGSSYDVFVKRWTGSGWTQITVNAVDKTLSRNAERPSIVLKSDNNPIIARDEEDGTSENILVRQF
jgi:hypothetical protein